jgi:ribonuclease P protein component
MPRFSLTKGERLTGNKAIASLFQSGRGFSVPPLRFIYLPVEAGEIPARMAVAVPKRLFRKAVDRNLLKRRIREAYRIQKEDLFRQLSEKGTSVHLVIQYQRKEIEEYQRIGDAVKKGLRQLALEITG